MRVMAKTNPNRSAAGSAVFVGVSGHIPRRSDRNNDGHPPLTCNPISGLCLNGYIEIVSEREWDAAGAAPRREMSVAPCESDEAEYEWALQSHADHCAADSVEARNRAVVRCLAAGKVERHLIDVAPSPTLGRIVALDDRVPGRMKMLGRVAIRRVVATSDMSAGAADSQMNPNIARLEAFLAT